jgi:hypothetical protein
MATRLASIICGRMTSGQASVWTITVENHAITLEFPAPKGRWVLWRYYANDLADDPVATHALPANSRVSVDTFTFSPSLMKRGTRISRPVSSLAVLVPPPEESPRMPGSV